MTQAKPMFATFEEYLSYSDELEGRFQLIDGALFELPPESPENDFIAHELFWLFSIAKVVSRQLIRTHIAFPVLSRYDLG
jgi:Uma2 family endonuclease